ANRGADRSAATGLPPGSRSTKRTGATAKRRQMHKAILFASAILLSKLYALQVAAPASPSPSPAPEPLPLTQIAARGEELSRALRDIVRDLPPASELADFDAQLREQEESAQTTLEESAATLERSATIMEIREQSRRLRAYSLPEAQQR